MICQPHSGTQVGQTSIFHCGKIPTRPQGVGERNLRQCVAGEGMDGGEPGVARRDTVASVDLEVVEEGEDVVGSQIEEVQSDDGPSMTHGEETQEDGERVAVAEDCVGTHASDPGQVVGEEAAQRAAESVGTNGSHGIPSPPGRASKRCWECRANRSLAASAMGSRKAR